MAWNSQQQYPYYLQEWNPYAANSKWNMMSMFPGLLPGANLNQTGQMYPMNGNSSVSHFGSYYTSGLNKRVTEQPHPLLVPQSEISPPHSPRDVENPDESSQLSEPSLPLNSLSPPHSPPLDLNHAKYPTPSGFFTTHPHATNPFLQPSLGAAPFSLSSGFYFPQTIQEPCEGHLAAQAAAASMLNLTPLTEVATRDSNGRKLPRWMIKRCVCQVCNKRFESRHKLQLHMYSHTGERPHKCEICGMRFSRKFCYKRHLKTVHTVVP